MLVGRWTEEFNELSDCPTVLCRRSLRKVWAAGRTIFINYRILYFSDDLCPDVPVTSDLPILLWTTQFRHTEAQKIIDISIGFLDLLLDFMISQQLSRSGGVSPPPHSIYTMRSWL